MAIFSKAMQFLFLLLLLLLLLLLCLIWGQEFAQLQTLLTGSNSIDVPNVADCSELAENATELPFISAPNGSLQPRAVACLRESRGQLDMKRQGPDVWILGVT
jgi:hypothetical protein